MKKLFNVIACLCISTVLIVGCGQSASECEVKVKSTDVTGELSDYYKVVDGTYKLTTSGEASGMKDSYEYQIKVQITRTDSEFDFDAADLESRGYFAIVCDLFDESGTPVVLADRDGFRAQGVNSADAALASLKPGETGWAIFTFRGDAETMAKVKSLVVGSTANLDQADVSVDGDVDDDASDGATDGGGDCEQFITDYGDFADSYVALLKKYKANPTDPDILNEYAEAAQKATQMQNDAADCSDPAYASKLAEIATRIAQAAM